MTKTYDGKTAEEWLAEAADSERRSAESWERSDTDGFLTQWAADTMAREYRLCAALARTGGLWDFPALFDLEGNLIAAKLIETQYGMAWGVLENDDPRSNIVKWVGRSHARSAEKRQAAMEKKGYREGTVRAYGRVATGGNRVTVYHYVVRTDGGFDRDAEVVDNGIAPYAVVDLKDAEPGDNVPVLKLFATEEEARAHIATILTEDDEDDRYGIDGPGE